MRFRLFAVLLALCVAAPAMAQHDDAADRREFCEAGNVFMKWKMPHTNSAQLKMGVDIVVSQLAPLCVMQPDFSDGEYSYEWTHWLSAADQVIEAIDMVVADRFKYPISAGERPAIMALLKASARLQHVIGVRRMRAYTAKRVEVKEVVRTVEVPVPCPAPEPPRESACVSALRQSAGRWSDQIYAWTRNYSGSGAEYALGNSSRADLINLSKGQGDPVAYVVGWMAQWRTIRRHQDDSYPFKTLRDGPLPQIAADMRAQLQLCGQLLPDQDR